MKLYVGNLPFSVTEEALKKAFSEFGNVEEANIIVDKFSKRSKGFGFVTFADDESAKKAVEGMNEKEFEGRSLKVSEAKPMDDSERPRSPPRRDFNRGSSSGSGRSFGNRSGGDSRGSGNRSFGNRDSRGPRRY